MHGQVLFGSVRTEIDFPVNSDQPRDKATPAESATASFCNRVDLCGQYTEYVAAGSKGEGHDFLFIICTVYTSSSWWCRPCVRVLQSGSARTPAHMASVGAVVRVVFFLVMRGFNSRLQWHAFYQALTPALSCELTLRWRRWRRRQQNSYLKREMMTATLHTRFAHVWNEIVDAMREEDILSDRERMQVLVLLVLVPHSIISTALLH